jgi:hypothetical protein
MQGIFENTLLIHQNTNLIDQENGSQLIEFSTARGLENGFKEGSFKIWLRKVNHYLYQYDNKTPRFGITLILSEDADLSSLYIGNDKEVGDHLNPINILKWEYWEFAEYGNEVDCFSAVILLTDYFGINFIIPGELVRKHQALFELFSSIEPQYTH